MALLRRIRGADTIRSVPLRLRLAGLAVTPLLIAAGPAPTPTPFTNATLANAVRDDLPSIVTVMQNVSGALRDQDGTLHGPYVGAYSGTGFFISSDGYLVTAAHVAAPSPDEVKGELADFYIDEKYKCDPSTATDHCDGVQTDHHDEVMNSTTAVDPAVDLRVLTQDMNPIDDGVSATLVSSSPTLAQDNAVLHIQGSNEPVMKLNCSSNVSVGAAMAVIGYPASGYDNGPTLVPTTTAGHVVDERHGDPGMFDGLGGDADLLQIDAHTEHGNSGGPGVSADGSVIGIVSFGDTLQRNYLISARDVCADVAKTPAIHNTQGEIDTLYHQGLDAYDAGDYATAKADFDKCATLNPVQIYCSDLSTEAANGGPQSAGGALADTGISWPERGGWILLGLLMGAAGAALVLRRRGPSSATASAQLAQQYAYAVNGQQGYAQYGPAQAQQYTPATYNAGYAPDPYGYAQQQRQPAAPAPVQHPSYSPAPMSRLHSDAPQPQNLSRAALAPQSFNAVELAYTRPAEGNGNGGATPPPIAVAANGVVRPAYSAAAMPI
jgi:S1-C subfamily serine protease